MLLDTLQHPDGPAAKADPGRMPAAPRFRDHLQKAVGMLGPTACFLYWVLLEQSPALLLTPVLPVGASVL